MITPDDDIKQGNYKSFSAMDDLIENLHEDCDHIWTGRHVYVPGEPDEYIEYCELCGTENPGTILE